MQERLENTLLERDSYLSLYTMAKLRAEKAEEKNQKTAEQQESIVELLVEKFGFVDRILDNNTLVARDLFKPDTNIEIFINFNVQLSTGELGYIETVKGCPSGKFKVCIPSKSEWKMKQRLIWWSLSLSLDGLAPETRDMVVKQDLDSPEQVRVILKFRKYLFQSTAHLDETV